MIPQFVHHERKRRSVTPLVSCRSLPVFLSLKTRVFHHTLPHEKASAARDEADHLATRLSHRSAGFEGLEAEVAALRAGMEVARAEATEREGVCARMEAEAERWGHGNVVRQNCTVTAVMCYYMKGA